MLQALPSFELLTRVLKQRTLVMLLRRTPERTSSERPLLRTSTAFSSSAVVPLDETDHALRLTSKHGHVNKRKVILLRPLPEVQGNMLPLPAPQQGSPAHPTQSSRSKSCSSVKASLRSSSPTSVLQGLNTRNQKPRGDLSTSAQASTQDAAICGTYPTPSSVTGQDSCQPLGSWASRQVYHDLSSQLDSPTPLPSEAIFSNSIATAFMHAPERQLHKTKAGPIAQRITMHAAWHRNFRHKWAKEQRHMYLSEGDECDTEDPWHKAFHMIQAACARSGADMPLPDHDAYAYDAAPSPLLDSDDVDGTFESATATVSPIAHLWTEVEGQAPSQLRHALGDAAAKARLLFKHKVMTPCPIPKYCILQLEGRLDALLLLQYSFQLFFVTVACLCILAVLLKHDSTGSLISQSIFQV